MQKVILDADVVIDYIRTTSSALDNIFKSKAKIYIPAIVASEIYSGKDTLNPKKSALIAQLIDRFEFVPADYLISQRAGFLVRDTNTLKLSDALVAATALSLNAKLATRNKKHFAEVKDLRFYKI